MSSCFVNIVLGMKEPRSIFLLPLIMTALLVVFSTCVQKAPERKKTGFVWENSNGKVYDIYITEKGACYILVTSEMTGKQFESYLPKDVTVAIREQMIDSCMILLDYNKGPEDSVDLHYIVVPTELEGE